MIVVLALQYEDDTPEYKMSQSYYFKTKYIALTFSYIPMNYISFQKSFLSAHFKLANQKIL